MDSTTDHVTLDLNSFIIKDSVMSVDYRVRATLASLVVARIAWGIRQIVIER